MKYKLLNQPTLVYNLVTYTNIPIYVIQTFKPVNTSL